MKRYLTAQVFLSSATTLLRNLQFIYQILFTLLLKDVENLPTL